MADQSGINERQRELFIRKSTRVAAAYLKRAKELAELPDAAKPFFDVLENTYVNNVKEITGLEYTSPSDFTRCGAELLRMADIQKPEERKSIGTLCVMVPAELVYAAGAMPVRLCSGSYTAYSIGDDYIPRDACPLVKAVMGFGKIKALPAFDNCSLLVAPVTCDCKKKLAGTIDSVKDTIPLHIPPLKKDDADTEIFLKELYRLIPLLENVTGKQVTAKSLAEGINMVGNAQYEMSEFLKYRRHDLSLMSGTQVMAVMNAYSYMPANIWAEQMHRLNEEMKLRLSQGRFVSRKNQPRILVTGSPIAFPNIKVPLLIEEMGGVLAADETCMGERGLYDPVSVIDASFDGMMRSLASRYTKPCTCPVFVDNSQRIYRIKQMIKEHKIQGVIYHVLRGCLVYDYEYQLMEEAMGKMDIPIIRVESDYNEEDVEQLRIRIEAFIELIKMRTSA
ncbi:2-hydroxyacyl-CoA dehydratase [bacterium C-53]|nr:2-hydroxyacyl-CoA dehydratase [Lachnospiraceae bacterium]NBI04127.1 2-hydroxyacyl-CoA dehydratase [Lachnospiraceae bacterium]RKJ08601.1 2-hydroxyacyl-CoA dehydratase [bacterium C-53]